VEDCAQADAAPDIFRSHETDTDLMPGG
jgi:hypothetical protein